MFRFRFKRFGIESLVSLSFRAVWIGFTRFGCGSHGSASGSLNEDSIFYLMSRGLNNQQAKELLINGFLLDVVEKITDSEIKNLIKNMIGIKE